MAERYYTVDEMVDAIDEPNRSACQKLLMENRKLFQSVQGSTNNHQVWFGGYWDHIQEVMNIGLSQFYWLIRTGRHIPFSLSDVLLVLFLHDVEKPWKYEFGPDMQLRPKERLRSKEAQHAFRIHMLQEYGIKLTEAQLNALTYVEGENKAYTNKYRAMNELAAVCHVADIYSARLFHAYPLEKHDPWFGAGRPRE